MDIFFARLVGNDMREKIPVGGEEGVVASEGVDTDRDREKCPGAILIAQELGGA